MSHEMIDTRFYEKVRGILEAQRQGSSAKALIQQTLAA